MMTYDELICYCEYFKDHPDTNDADTIRLGTELFTSMIEAIKEIKEIKANPCEDCVSRQAVLDLLQMRLMPKEEYKAIYEMPSVTPVPKTGRWKRISMDKYIQHAMAFYRCSECGKDIIGTHNYCPNCGAKMEVSE